MLRTKKKTKASAAIKKTTKPTTGLLHARARNKIMTKEGMLCNKNAPSTSRGEAPSPKTSRENKLMKKIISIAAMRGAQWMNFASGGRT